MIIFKTSQQPIARNYDSAQLGIPNITPNQSLENIDKANFLYNFIAVFSSIFLSSIGYGILMVLISLQVEHHIKNEILISISTATQISSGVFFARFLPGIVAKYGALKTIRFYSIISALSAVILCFYFNYFWWLIVILAFGISLFSCGVVRQTIMIDIAPVKSRAIIISCGTMVVSIGNSLGPLIYNIVNFNNQLIIHLIACGFYLVSIIPILRLNFSSNNICKEKKITIFRYIKNSPKIMLAGFCTSYALSSTNAFLIIYGIKVGLSTRDSAMLLSTLLFGTILSIPIGYLADIINRRLLMIFSAFMALICSFYLLYQNNVNEIHLALFLLFGFLAGVKLPAIVLINEKYKQTQRISVNTAFARFSLTGNIFGLFSTGLLMKSIGPQGLWASICLILTIFLVICLSDYFMKVKKGQFELSTRIFIKKEESIQKE